MKMIATLLIATLISFSNLALATEATAPSATQQETSVAIIQPVDINSADIKTLMTLKQIGKSRANAIVEYRNSNGRFNSVEELLMVPGIGKKIVDDNREQISLGAM